MAWQHDQLDWITKSGEFTAEQQATLIGLGNSPAAIAEIQTNAGGMHKGAFHADFIASSKKYLVEHPVAATGTASPDPLAAEKLEHEREKLETERAETRAKKTVADATHNDHLHPWRRPFFGPRLPNAGGTAAPAAAKGSMFGWKTKLGGAVAAAVAAGIGYVYLSHSDLKTPATPTSSVESALTGAGKQFVIDAKKELSDKGSTSFSDNDVNFTIKKNGDVYTLSSSFNDATGAHKADIVQTKHLDKLMDNVALLKTQHQGYLASFAKYPDKNEKFLKTFRDQVALADQAQSPQLALNDGRSRANMNAQLQTFLPAGSPPQPAQVASATPTGRLVRQMKVDFNYS